MTPASIRYKNPGAMWGGNPVSRKWGETGNVALADGTGQGNKIAVFPTFVQGICAQIDLWRGPRYRNKKFRDAIAIWSGGNSVPQYIDFVAKRVPGFTGDTIIDDAFLRSSKGIAFLKAQAWHEAGQPYPASDADWIEAQKRVFNAMVVSSATNVQNPTAVVDLDLKAHQQSLLDAGYFEVGKADGLIGGKTMGAIKAFFVDRHISAKSEYPSDILDRELAAVVRENWTRPIAPSRGYATQETVSKQVASIAPTAKAGFWQSIVATVSGVFSVGGAAVKLLPDANETVSPYAAVVQQWFPSVPTIVIFAAVAAIAVATVIQLRRANAATVGDYQIGKIN